MNLDSPHRTSDYDKYVIKRHKELKADPKFKDKTLAEKTKIISDEWKQISIDEKKAIDEHNKKKNKKKQYFIFTMCWKKK